MSLPQLIQKTVSAVLNSPLLQALGMGDVYNVLNEHFVLSAQEITQAYQKSYAYALSAIAAGLASDDSWQNFWQKITESQLEQELSSQIVGLYLEPFAQAQGLQGPALDEFRQQAIQDCQALAAQQESLFQIAQFQLTEAELAALVNDSEIATLSELVIAHLQSVAETRALLSEPLAQFLAYHNLLGHALLFFLNEALRDNERFKATLDNLRQQGLLAEIQNVQEAQSRLQAFFTQKLTAIEQQLATQNQRLLQAATPAEFAQIGEHSKTLLLDQQTINQSLAEIPQRLQQLQSEWQTTQTAFIQFSQQFSQWTVFASTQLETIVAALPDLQYSIEQLDDKVDVLLDGQEKLSEGQQILFDELQKLAARLEVSAQIKPRDEFTQYSGTTEVKLRQAIAQFKNLPHYLDYPQVTLQVGSLSSVLGDLKTAEGLFFDIIQRTQNKHHKARAYMNLFHIYLRNGPQFYDKALKSLQKAIHLDRAQYVLHNVDQYPIQRILGAGGMGCVFLCHNTLEAECLGQECFVVVKCLWETQRGEPNKIFAEPLAMAKIAGNSVPQPLSYGYVDIAKQERAYFVTEFIEGAMDGEAWLAQQGKLDVITGVQVGIQIAQCLQKAHEQNILHLDLKPANVLLKASDSGLSVKIIDFGLARIATSLRQHAALAQTHKPHTQLAQQVFGTFDYAPPEQRGDLHYSQVTEKSDVFALGKTLYRLFSGKRPQDNIRQKYLPDAPGLHELLEDCVESEPAERPNIDTVLTHLTALLPKKTVKVSKQKVATDNPQQVTKYQAKQTEQKNKPQATKQKYRNQSQKKTENGSEVKAIIIFMVLLGYGFILPFAILFFLNYVSEGIGVGISIIIIGCLYLFGQFLWRHRQTMSLASKITGLIDWYKHQTTEQKEAKPITKKSENGSQVKAIIIFMVLVGYGFILPFAILFFLNYVM
ncbi:MAG: hypothetical protein DRR00_20555 [Candidatus Parabeggiatoa sp. nov. 3]|nr:MAG: hypothetical protein DRR00_20555 [Gammaproteobacteria bacterium]RKZ65008.1 MAG: hypothetical protein DRQ99_13945 [Gammaproteobacteria bacterium]